MMKAIAVDDEPLALELIEVFCKQVDGIALEKSFSKTAAALNYLEKNAVDLLFLDINMPAMSGIDFYRSLLHKPMLVLTTSYSEYAVESYELDAIDYLLKPFTLHRFDKAVKKAKSIYEMVKQTSITEPTKYLMLKADYGIIKVIIADILFIEGLDNYIKIHLVNQPALVIRLTMKSLMEKLNKKEFVRVHRSYIIPIYRIECYRQRMISIAGEEIPVGKNYEDALKLILNSGE